MEFLTPNQITMFIRSERFHKTNCHCQPNGPYLSSLTILPWDSRFPGQLHGLTISYENLTVNRLTSWCVNSDLSSLTISLRDSRFPGKSHSLTISYENLTVNGFTNWYINYFRIIRFLKFNSRVPYFSKDRTPQSILRRQMPNHLTQMSCSCYTL